MTTKAYLWGWFAYLLGSVGVLFVLWYITRPLRGWLRLPLRALAAALLLMPWPVSPNHQEWGPAWVVSLFDGLAREDAGRVAAGAVVGRRGNLAPAAQARLPAIGELSG
mgnify:CR=1 FL=1